MEFVRKRPEDAEELSEYLHPIWHEVFDPLMPYEEAEYIFTTWTNPDAIRKAMSDGYEFGYVYRDSERLGLYSYHLQDDKRFYINKLYYEPQFRGKGFGNEALRKMISIARENECSEVYLNVYYRNERAFKAYLRAGLTDCYRCSEDIGGGYSREDYIMSMKL